MIKKSLRSSLIVSTASIILRILVFFSVVAFVYLLYISEIIQKIYDMEDDFLQPIFSILMILLILLIVVALCTSILSSVSISNRFLNTITHFTKDIKLIKQEGMNHRLSIEGEDELAALGNEFNALMDQVEDTMQKQTQFISDASHELKTPLAILKGNLDMLNRWGKEDKEVLDNALVVSAQEVDRLIILCEELLHLTKVEAVDKTKIKMVDVIQQACHQMQEMHPEFEIVCVADESEVFMKEEHLKQLSIIFLDNAIKYAKEDSKKIEVTIQDKVLTFKDYGMGIPKDALANIFDRFYKVEESREQQNNSFGLGLAIAKRICTQYGCTLQVESEYQVYTKFIMNCHQEEEETV